MNKITSIILTLLTVGCANYSNNQAESNSIDKQELKNEITIDSVIVEEKELKDICFVIYKSTFPKIKGLLDKNFENQLNDIFSKNFNSYIDNAEKEYGGCLDTENTDEYSMENIPAAAGSRFEVLTKNDSIISVVQFMTAEVGHGGNAWIPSSISLTADVKNKIIYGNKEFKIDRNKTDHLNTKIKTYFDKLFPDQKKSNGIDYPLIKTSDDINKLSFGLRNDSLVLIIQAYPTGHYSYTTYIIPIDQVKQ
jgi:hypothetical protein